jgi:hypothetical protein
MIMIAVAANVVRYVMNGSSDHNVGLTGIVMFR